MAAADNPKLPETTYAPPQSEPEEPYGLGAPVGWAPLAAIATGVVSNMAWTLYADLQVTGDIGRLSWLKVGVNLLLWGGLTSLLILRVSWARTACRVFAVLTVGGAFYSLVFAGGSGVFYLAGGLRVLIFAVIFVLLRAPVRHRPTPLWMQTL